MAFKKENSAGYLVNHVARLFAAGLQQRIAPLGLTIGQFPVLLQLWQKDGVTQRELLASLDLEQATLANTLNRMERDGLIVRNKHPSDARAQQIRLTDSARVAREAAFAAATAENEDRLAPLTKDEQTLFLDFMRRIIAAGQEVNQKSRA